MTGQGWQCQECGYEVYDNDGETGEVNGTFKQKSEIYADDPCRKCGGLLKLITTEN